MTSFRCPTCRSRMKFACPVDKAPRCTMCSTVTVPCNCDAIHEVIGRFKGDTHNGHHVDCVAQNAIAMQEGA